MLWSFLAVLFSGWLYVDASYRGPQWQRWVFKPVTLLLLVAWAWQAPVLNATDYLIMLGLLATLIGDALTLLPQQRMLYAIGAFFLSHLLYTISFAGHMTLSFFWPIPLVMLLIGVVLIAILWTRLDELRWPVCTFIGMTLVMVWLSAEQYYFRPDDYSFSLLVGAIFLLLASSVWFISHYRRRFSADRAIVAACYFAGHFMIVRSLYL
ncbi:lysoplasmalogenase [Winslowiella iniecta]|uniref:Membrane protein n=1 Tax=Winslowiella iniecta TaxID=1560201 RepID=A0A0L7T6N7_9GAMM|nr:lysoplasmalogenase [Winslowiella iniecta]KOC91052.1 membrane protein [Winslowiella iniecta]KOC93809.1 membrane protein [Winslowiella iniecta]